MFIGYYALALAAKPMVPRTSLGALFAATQLPDLVWPVCVLAGWERVEIVPGITAFNPLLFSFYPWSHSLLMVAAWGAVAGVVYFLWTRERAGAIAVASLAVSHWVLDWISHRPDLPFWPGGSRHVGLGLWNSVPATLAVEGGMWAAGSLVYSHRTTGIDRTGKFALWSLLAILTVFYIAGPFGPPPPSYRALGWFALAGGLLPPCWAAWADRHRRMVTT